MLKWINESVKELGNWTLSNATTLFESGYGLAKRSVGAIPFFGSNEVSESYESDQVDEKHYFVLPYRMAKEGYSLYSMRCLPKGVPVINDLPKQRIFHLPQENVDRLVEALLSEQAAQEFKTDPESASGFGKRLSSLADEIDNLDDKLFGGVLLIGGLVAFINPVAGATIAAKALVPSAGMLLSKFGLRAAGENLTDRAVKQEADKARETVLNEFRDSRTHSILNPILAELDLALSTDETQHDPLIEFDFQACEFGERDQQRMKQVTCRAVANAYSEILADPKQFEAASLGAEDVRWLKLIEKIAEDDSPAGV